MDRLITRPLIVLYKLLLEIAIDKGFSIYGICYLIDKMETKKIINPAEHELLYLDVQHAKPKDTTLTSGYFWPTGLKHEHHRINFIQQRIKLYESKRT